MDENGGCNSSQEKDTGNSIDVVGNSGNTENDVMKPIDVDQNGGCNRSTDEDTVKSAHVDKNRGCNMSNRSTEEDTTKSIDTYWNGDRDSNPKTDTVKSVDAHENGDCNKRTEDEKTKSIDVDENDESCISDPNAATENAVHGDENGDSNRSTEKDRVKSVDVDVTEVATPPEVIISDGHGNTLITTQHNSDAKMRTYADEATRMKVPDGGWGWMVVFAGFIVHIIFDGISYCCGIVLADIRVYFNCGRTEVGWMASIFFYVTYGFGVIYGPIISQFGCRAVGVAGAVISSGCLMVSAFAPNIYFLFFSFSVGVGCGFGMMYMAVLISISQYFDKRISFASGLAVCGSGIGSMIFAPLVTFLLDEYGWRATLMLQGGIALHCCAACAVLRPVMRKTKTKQVQTQTLSIYRRLLKMPLFLLFIVSRSVGSLTWFAPHIFLPDMVVQAGLTARQASLVVSAVGISNTVSRAGFGWLGDIGCASKLTLSVVFSGVLAISMVPLSFQTTFYGFVINMSIFGGAAGVAVAISFVLVVDLFGSDLTTHSFGLQNIIISTVGLFGPGMAGLLYDTTQTFHVPFLTLAAVAFISEVMLFSIRFTSGYKHREENNAHLVDTTRV